MIITAIIPARAGSKRLKDKNIYPVWGKPMLHWAVSACKSSNLSIDPWVSTDSQEIASIARESGASVVFRDAVNANDYAFKQAAIRDAALKIDHIKGKSDIYISLQANTPEIQSHHLEAGIEMLLQKNRNEIICVDSDLMQNGAFRIFRGDYVYQRDLSTSCGCIVYDLVDVHTLEDVRQLGATKS
jgi:CMP-N,N'-diacetyllegionaminic acid synthase